MKKNVYLIAILSLACLFPTMAQNKATGMSNIKLFLDPGHALKENQGLYKYSEAEKTLRVAKAIKEYLLTYTDMQEANIRMCREDDNTQVTLTERTDAANAWGADFYYSIHSDAGSSPTSANTTLFMYGGWRTNGVIFEKTPYGGKDYGEILTPNYTGVMRITTRGNLADRTYYDAAQNHTNKYPYLHVNRESNMASLLSEGGFHTHYVQQARNLNAEWKRLEGYAAYQSLVKYLSGKYGAAAVDPVQIGIVTGFITDGETDLPVNGATVTVINGTGEGASGKNYTTDSYESLFKNYSNKPDELHNGFYFVEGLTPGATVTVKVEAHGFQHKDTTLLIPAAIGATTQEGLGVMDIALLNLLPAAVTAVDPENLTAVPINKPLILTFSRKMNRASVESATGFAPAANVSYTWTNDYTLRIDISKLAFETDYVMTIDGSVAKNTATDNFLDGDNDGTEGGDYVLNFKTGEQDVTPPVIVSYDPQNGSGQEVSARPIVRIEFSEPLNPASIAPNQITVTDENNETVGGTQRYITVNGKSVLHYFFTADLNPNKTYKVVLASGIEDLYGNEPAGGLEYTFTARPRETTLTTVLDNFESMGTWWQPNGSGSTTGIDAEVTKIVIDRDVLATTASTGSLKLDYRWLDNSSSRLIRLHNTATSPKFSKDNAVQYYLFGDGSHTKFRVALRNGGSGSFYAQQAVTIDWVGWKKITWDISADPFDHWLIGGTDDIPDGNVLNLSAFGIEGAPAEYLSFLPSAIYVDELQVVKLGDYLSIKSVQNAEAIMVYSLSEQIKATASQPINDIRIYSISGALVKAAQPGQTSVQILTGDLAQGVYIVKVTAGNSQKNVKVLVK